jgi:hypothetical protein
MGYADSDEVILSERGLLNLLRIGFCEADSHQMK